MSAIFMRADRTLCELDQSVEEAAEFARIFLYVLASDGIYVPKCDIVQYEAGNRPPVIVDVVERHQGGVA